MWILQGRCWAVPFQHQFYTEFFSFVFLDNLLYCIGIDHQAPAGPPGSSAHHYMPAGVRCLMLAFTCSLARLEWATNACPKQCWHHFCKSKLSGSLPLRVTGGGLVSSAILWVLWKWGHRGHPKHPQSLLGLTFKETTLVGWVGDSQMEKSQGAILG